MVRTPWSHLRTDYALHGKGRCSPSIWQRHPCRNLVVLKRRRLSASRDSQRLARWMLNSSCKTSEAGFWQGYNIGERKAFKYKLEVQLVLGQMQIEKNTR